MPKTSVTAPMPSRSHAPLSASTTLLAKQVNARGLCTRAHVSAVHDPWFPTTQVEDDLIQQARRVCGGCPVVRECAELALRQEASLPTHQIYGIFGALAPGERREMIAQRRRAVA
jgi:hypothetical protein